MSNDATNSTTLSQELLRPVWQAISEELQSRGDSDIQAGLGWFSDEDGKAVARAAIIAWKPEQACREAWRSGYQAAVDTLRELKGEFRSADTKAVVETLANMLQSAKP